MPRRAQQKAKEKCKRKRIAQKTISFRRGRRAGPAESFADCGELGAGSILGAWPQGSRQVKKYFNRPRGPMDKASAYGAGDCRLELCWGHLLCCAALRRSKGEARVAPICFRAKANFFSKWLAAAPAAF